MHASRSHRQQGRCPPPALPASTDAKSRVGGTALSTDESARAQAAGACAMGLSGGAGGWRDGAPLEIVRHGEQLIELMAGRQFLLRDDMMGYRVG